MQTLEESNQRHCRLKRKFTDEAEVMRVYSADVGVKGNWQKRSRSTHIYVCAACGYMHIGHMKPKYLRRMLRAQAAGAGQ